MKTYKGIWNSHNEFILEDTSIIKVVPYNYIARQYEEKFPLHCYINVMKETGFIFAVMEIDDELEPNI